MQTDNERETQMSFFDQDLWFSKMSRDCFPQMEVKTSESSSKSLSTSSTVTPMFLDCRTDRLGLIAEPLWETDGLSLGGYTIVSFGESPNEEKESRLSQILEVNPLPKYALSKKACIGILTRSENHGKELPPILREALMEQASRSNSEGGAEYDSQGRKSGKGPLIQEELSGTVGAVQDQTLIRVYGISPEESNAMKSKNPNSGIYEAETSRTLDNNGGKPDCKQGGMMIVQEEPISYGLDRASFNQGQNAKFDISVQEELAQPIVARGVGGGNDNQVVGSLQARDYKGVGNQYVNEGKVIVQRTD